MHYWKRSIKNLSAVVVFILLYFCQSLQAAEGNILKELLEAAQKNDNQLLIAKAQLDAAKAAVAQNLAPILPQVSFNYQISKQNTEETNSYLGQVSLTQTIYEPVKYRSYRAAKARTEQFGYQYGSAYFELFQRLLGQYLDILTETDRLRTLAAQKERLSKQLEVASNLVAVGTRSAVDLAEIRANSALSESQYLQSKISLHTFYEGLSESVKLTIHNLPPVRSDLNFPPLENKDPEHWKEIALKNNLGLLAAKASVEAAKHDVRVNNRGHIPTFNLFATYTDGIQLQPSGEAGQQTEVGVRFNLPIFSGGGVSAGTKAAKSRLKQAQRQLALADIEIRTIVPSLVRLINNGEQFINAAKQTMDARKSLVTQTELRYRLGAADITDLLLVYERFYQAERDYYLSLYSHIKNYADFYIRTGQLNEKQLAQFYKIGDIANYDPQEKPYQ